MVCVSTVLFGGRARIGTQVWFLFGSDAPFPVAAAWDLALQSTVFQSKAHSACPLPLTQTSQCWEGPNRPSSLTATSSREPGGP